MKKKIIKRKKNEGTRVDVRIIGHVYRPHIDVRIIDQRSK